MNRTSKKFAGAGLVVATVALLSGCASGPYFNSEQLAQMQCGRSPENYQEAITNWITPTLKDPDSAEYKFETPYRQALPAGVFNMKKFWLGWEVDAQVNAKNSYGGYVGYTPYSFFFQGDEIRATAQADVLSGDWVPVSGINAVVVTNTPLR